MKKIKSSKFNRLINSPIPTSRNNQYSNVTLFNRREEERESITNLKFQKTTSNFYNYKNSLPFVTQTTLNKKKMNKTSYSKNKHIKTNSDFSNYPKTFYLTQNQNFFSENNLNVDFSNCSNDNLSDYGTKKNPIKGNVILLSQFEEKAKSLNNTKRIKKRIDKKINQLSLEQHGVHESIKQTRDVLLKKYTINIKKERAIRLNENYENELKTLERIIKSLNKTQILFNEEFYTKFGDYIKQISLQRENEKEINSTLIEKVIKLKGEISQIQTKLQKIDIDKNNIIRWIYFQILVKEKILSIPLHYKVILEDNDESYKSVLDNIQRRESTKINFDDKLHMNFYRKNSVKRLSDKKIFYQRRYTRYQMQVVNNPNLFCHISQGEIDRIKLYKFKPAFNSPDDFMDMIKKYEMENNQNLNVYNDLRLELRYLNKEKEQLEKEKKNELDLGNEIILSKKDELKIIKERFKFLVKEKINLKSYLKNNLKKLHNEKKKRRKTIYDFDNNKLYNYKANLEDKIKSVYLTCQEVNLDKIISIELIPIRKNTTKEEELIDLLSKIELVLSYLIGKLQMYRKNNIYYDELKKIQSEIEKEHKIEKNRKQREQEMIKLKRLKEQIEERNEKIYFIPKRNCNDYYEYVKKKDDKKNKNKKKLKEPVFEDYMYDIEKYPRSFSQ